jgi:predicted phage gp36 major capsid-like protein
VQTSLTTTGQQLAIWVDWSGFTIVDRFGVQIELIPHLFGATNRFPTGQRGILYIWRSSSGVIKPNALRLICSDLLLDHLRVPTGYPSAHIGGY